MKLPDWLIPGTIGEHWDNPRPKFLEALIEVVVRDCANVCGVRAEKWKDCWDASSAVEEASKCEKAILTRYNLAPKENEHDLKLGERLLQAAK